MNRLTWTTQPSTTSQKFDFLIGRLGSRILFTAAPVSLTPDSDYLLRQFILGDTEQRVSRAELEQTAEKILADAIEELTQPPSPTAQP